MPKLLLVLLLLFSLSVHAQEGTLTGKITDSESGEPLIGATVIFGTTGVSTDIDGKYRLKLPAGKQKVRFSFIGYESKSKEVEMEDGITVRQDMALALESHQHQTVVVSASQYEKKIEEETVSVGVVSGDNLKDRNAQDIGQAISKTSGVLVQDGQISIRGGSSYSYGVGSRTAVLVDGMSAMSADLGDGKLKFAPTENTEQVEVIKGSASVVYGSSALNGVVNVLTAWPKSEKPSHEITTFATVYDRTPIAEQQWWTKHSTRGAMGLTYLYDQKVGRTDVVVGSNIYRHQSYLEENDELRGRISIKTRVHHKKKKGLNYGLNYTLMFEQSERFFLAQDLDTNAFRVSDGSDDRYLTMNLDPHLHYADSMGNRHSADFRWFYIHRFGNGADPDAISNQIIENYQYQKHWGWNKNSMRVGRPEHRVIMTTGMPATLGISTSNLYPGTRETYSAAVYVQGEYKLIWADSGAVRRANRAKSGNSDTLRALSLVGGVRYEVLGVEDIFESGLPIFRTGLNYKFGKASFFRSSFGQSYRLPSVGERYITNDLFNTLRIIANPELQPEKGWNLEFGLTQGFQILNFKAGFDAAFFWQEYKQFVEYRFVSAGTEPDLFAGDSLFVGLYPSNVENARVAGFEIGLTGSGKIGAFEIVPSIGYTYTYPVNIDSFGTNVGEYLKMMFADLGRRVPEERKGQILQFRSRHLFVGDLAVTWKRISVGASVYYGSYPEVIPTTFGIAVGFLSGDFESFDRYEQEHLKGDWVFDVRASYGINDKLKVGFMVKNVANKYYSTRPSMPEPNRNYTLQLQVKF
jgi:outer membrane receptor protein involved in Fe transport